MPTDQKFLSLPLESCQNSSEEINQLTLTKGNCQITQDIFHFSLAEVN